MQHEAGAGDEVQPHDCLGQPLVGLLVPVVPGPGQVAQRIGDLAPVMPSLSRLGGEQAQIGGDETLFPVAGVFLGRVAAASAWFPQVPARPRQMYPISSSHALDEVPRILRTHEPEFRRSSIAVGTSAAALSMRSPALGTWAGAAVPCQVRVRPRNGT